MTTGNGAAATTTGGQAGVEFGNDYALLRHAALSKADSSELDGILAKYGSALYKIHVYDKGKVIDRRGDLSEAAIGKTIVSDIGKEAQARGLSAWTIRINGLACFTYCHQTTPTPSASASEKDALKKRLVEILKKYER